MRSFVIIEVEHGEDTDALDAAAREAQSYINGFDYFQDEGLTFIDYSVRVDLPPYITARSLTTHGLPPENPYDYISGWHNV